KLCDRFRIAGCCGLKSFVERHRICARSIFLASKSAQPAGSYADVGGIDMAIYVEIGNVAMHPLAHMICQPTHGQDIGGTIKSYGILKTEPLAGNNSFGNRQQAR